MNGTVISCLTFGPRFYDSRNTPRYQVEEKDIGASGPGSCTEFRYGSCWHSHLGWRHRICEILPGVETHSKTPIREIQSQGLKDVHSYDRGSWNHTRQYTFLRQGILKSYQAIYFLTTGILKSYQAIYFLMTNDFEIIPGNIL